MKTDLIPLALLMAAATYPARALLFLAPGRQLPAPLRLYLRLVAPAVLAAVAAVSVAITTSAVARPSLHVGPEWIAVALCATVVAMRRSLLLGLFVAAAFVVIARAVGLAPLP